MYFPCVHKCLYKAMKSSGPDNMKPLLTANGWREEEEIASTPGPRSDLLILCFLPVPDEAWKNKPSSYGSQTFLMHF